ncbi:DUF4145 domain-containing protein [Candidatus Nitrosoglobus terrae]|uniref:DUF4145 domain-containing protein n=1 Tax=Candidatus Nitrosoglobus terrae TaxID=1630141 RepID=UPI000BBAC04A|nr:DUF4145 domain-containing protein [Candidatus Nitrosoglobus terrae]
MGVRALLEGICVLEGIDDKKARWLAEKIGHLSDVSKISINIIERLKRITFIGNGAAHGLTPPDKLELSLSIDFLEALMMYMYEGKLDLECKAKLLKATHNRVTNY